MILRRMTATFGRLEQQTLTLTPGLNLLQIPNEGGKSTWSEFLLTMLYGLDTRQREKAGVPPVKTRYAPRSGRPMEGSLTLETDDGRRLVLQRTGPARAPMSQLTVRDADTGTLLPDVTGETLIGAEKSIYERSGFLRQQELVVTADGALERRLGSLVTAGSEDYSYLSLSAALRELQNRCRSRKSGLLPRLEEELAAVEQALDRVHGGQAQLAELTARERELDEQLQTLQQKQQSQAAERLRVAQAALEEAQEDLRGWERVCAELPDEARLQAMDRTLSDLNARAQTAAMEAAMAPIRLPEPVSDPVFRGLSAEEAAAKAGTDAARIRALLQPREEKKRSVRLIAALFAAAAAAVLAGVLIPLWPLTAVGGGLLLVGAGLTAARLLRRGRARREDRSRRQQAEALLDAWGAESPDALPGMAEDYARRLEEQADRQAEAEARLAAAQAAAEALRQAQEALLAQVRGFVPDCPSLQKAAVFLSEARQARQALDDARRTEARRRERLAFYRSAPPAAADADGRTLTRCREELRLTRSAIDRQLGALQSLGDALVLEARREGLRTRIAQLTRTWDALALAQTVLAEADESLRAQFSPLLCRTAGQLFSRLTGGRYGSILLDRDMTVAVRETGSELLLPLSGLSAGTRDQLYLALRLALCQLLLPKAPLVLDDALVFFDDERAALALQVLGELAEQRQILLFTCHSREAALLQRQP